MNLRKMVFWAHLATGCLVGAVVLIMSVTGVLLSYERQITAWVDRDFRSTPPKPDSARLPIEAMLAQVIARNPAPPSAITLRSDVRAPAEVSFGREHVFLVDVYSGAVLGEGSAGTRLFFRKVENWHRWLAAGDDHRSIARAVTGACNLGFFVLVLSGPVLWLPRRWSRQSFRAVGWFRAGLSGRVRDFNWHNTIGVWCVAPLFVIVVSGVVMSYPWANNLIYRLTRSELPIQGNAPRPQSPQAQAPRGRGRAQWTVAGLDVLWSRAEHQIPNWRSITLRPPISNRAPAVFTIETGEGGRPDQRSQLTLDPRTAETLHWEPFSSYNTGRRLRSWLRFLHTGEAGGIAGQTIAGIASGGAAVLVWTGFCLAIRRLFRQKGRRTGAESTSAVGAFL